MPATTAVIIGAGQAGLAMSRCLSESGVEHVVFDRGRVAERWRAQSWDSLRLLTPNWMTRLPGFQYTGTDPDGFMSVPDLVTFLERYATSSRAPVIPETTVVRVEQRNDGFRVTTSLGTWRARAVVIATGYCDLPVVPTFACRLPPSVAQIVPSGYRRPAQLPPGNVLIVGASSTGVQLADEIRRSGREVVIAAGRHTRLPRSYRGRDILWWLDRIGALSQHRDAVHAIDISRHQPSLQLVGTPEHRSLDLGILREAGVRVVGRVRHIEGRYAWLSDDLMASTAAADIKLAEILARVDRFIDPTGVAASSAEPFRPTWPIASGAAIGTERLDLSAERIGAVIWATGYRRTYPWLHVPVLDSRGEIVHRDGVTPAAGLYVLGLQFQRCRNSSFIDGVGADARFIAERIVGAARRASAA
ncbi:MAG TPA: NAD(P)/FAD-dependent oxidoreductase [Vicinamibacterales bacterium]|nr:NAD(P)/FAD-dependent oxidoreductase [Vicinamibacterales bacterium]